MLTSYFKTAWRSFVRNQSFSIINISGLALGMACFLVILLWVQDEKNVDAFHKNGKLLYQVYEINYYDGKINADYPTPGLLADELKRVVPGIEYSAAMDYATQPGTGATFEAGKQNGKMVGFFVGGDFFKMFSYPLLQGTAAAALNEPNSIAISRKMAEYFFGNEKNITGRLIRFENRENLKVTAVFEDLPAASSQQFDYVRSWVDYIQQNDWVHNWGNTSPSTFIQLRPGADRAQVEKRIRHFIDEYKPKDNSFKNELGLQPYPERYLYSNFRNGYPEGGRIEYVRIFSVVAIFILLIACINFMNLATAQSAKRAKEVGLRKVIGALRSSLVIQFMSEAILLTLFAVFVSILLTTMVLPAFNDITGKQLALPFHLPVFWLLLVALILVTGIIAGSYPALFLSSMKPIRVLKGTLTFNWRTAFLRKGLVIVQFTLSIILIVSMIVIEKQVNYIQTKNLGYDRDNLLYIPIEGELIKNFSQFKNEAGKLAGITAISKMRNSPTIIEHHTGSISWEGRDPNLVISFADGVVGYDFVKTMKLRLSEGRDFSREYATDSTAYLINETAAGRIGMKDPIGKNLVWGNHPGKIIGVLKDFHFSSMHQAIDPLIVRLDENWPWGTILVRVQAGKTHEVIEGLGKIYKQMNPRFPFSYQFSDQEFARLYTSEQLIGKLSFLFSLLAIAISCLGLFGLAAYMAENRTREFGIRKILGASSATIMIILSGSFLQLVGIAFLVAAPLSWWAMNNWLQHYQYRTEFSAWIFVAAGLGALFIALLTVSFRAIRVALDNPVKSIRAE